MKRTATVMLPRSDRAPAAGDSWMVLNPVDDASPHQMQWWARVVVGGVVVAKSMMSAAVEDTYDGVVQITMPFDTTTPPSKAIQTIVGGARPPPYTVTVFHGGRRVASMYMTAHDQRAMMRFGHASRARRFAVLNVSQGDGAPEVNVVFVCDGGAWCVASVDLEMNRDELNAIRANMNSAMKT